MTYIEFFDNNATKNVAACLMYTPEQVIYIGNNKKLIDKAIADYDKIFKNRGHNIKFDRVIFDKKDLDYLINLLSNIVENYDDCIFDITGGDEMLILALGIVFSKYLDKNIQIHKINIRSNMVYDCDKDGHTVCQKTPMLSVEENIRIYGGEIVYGSVLEDNTYRWNLNAEFLNDVDMMWNICKTDVRYWNTQLGVFSAIEDMGIVSEDWLTTTASVEKTVNYLKKHKAKYMLSKGLINSLLRLGLLTQCSEDNEGNITISYKNDQVKKCLTKAGMLLEMKVFILAKAAVNKKGEIVYDDALNGVCIDWDGEFHDELIEDVYDTENEIDVLLMHDMIPVFISCKNGVVTQDELYKLNVVAERFGGEYAKKVLVVTSLSEQESAMYIRQRASDMGIKILEDIQDLSDGEISRKLSNYWKQ